MNADLLNAPIVLSDFVACYASIASLRVEHANCFSPVVSPVSHASVDNQTAANCFSPPVSVDNQTAAKTRWSSPQINQLHPILSNQFSPQAPIALLWTNCYVRFARTNGQCCGVQMTNWTNFISILHISNKIYQQIKRVI